MPSTWLLPHERALKRAKARVRSATFEAHYTKGRARYEADCHSRGERPNYPTLSPDARLFWELEADADPKGRRRYVNL